MQKEKQHETFIWTPLIGFDKEHADKGVEAYYSTIGFQPDGISLFVFCPDIVHDHDGMARERVLPPDNCNYYGSVRNEIRSIQEWTNFDLRDLVHGLEKRGAATYMGLMGVFVDRDPSDPEPYNIGHREWLFDHEEIIGVWTQARYSLNVLKRFKDGTYYEDFFLKKVRVALRDYGFSGVHAADNFCPPGSGGSAKNGDFSDDMIDQFREYSGLNLPAEITDSVDGRDRAGIQKRGAYIWNRYKQEWLEFLAWRWGAFWKKICDGLHEDGKKVMVNNAWCSEPFEALYRYGIDYQKLYEAGVDYLAAETVPTGVHSVKHNFKAKPEPYRFHNYMTMAALMKASVPEGKLVCLNGVKDATEEWSTLTYFPSHVEREVYTLTNFFLQTAGGLQRTTDGFLVCLGDGLNEDEWSWLNARYATGFSEIPDEVLTPTFIWSNAASESFLPDYIETKRWSAHKTKYELARQGALMGVLANIVDLDSVSGPIFVPNIDLLPEGELEKIAAYNRGPIVCTSLVERNFQLPNRQPEIAFQDPVAGFPMCCFGYDLGVIDHVNITNSLGEDDGSADISGDPRYVADPNAWREEMVFRKASTGFIKTCGRLVRALYECELEVADEHPFLPMRMKDGRIRILLGNDSREHYLGPVVTGKRVVKSVQSQSKFPALPAKMVDANGKIIVARSDGTHKSIAAYGFTTKVPPGGLTILDVEFE